MINEHHIKIAGITVFFASLFILLAVRLFLLQVYRKDFFTNLAKHQYTTTITIAPPRAPIYDRTGNFPLAYNQEVLSAFLLPQHITQPKKLYRFLKKHYNDAYKKLKKKKNKHFMWLDRKLPADKASFLQNQQLDDIQFTQEAQRTYSCHDCGHVIGFSDIDNKGIAGLELFFDKQLAGAPQQITLEKDARRAGNYFNKTIHNPGISGAPIVTSIDRTLQFFATQELEKAVTFHQAKAGSAIIMDPITGEILAMANYPTFNPNERPSANLETTKNNAITDCFELGSVVKMFCTLAAYEENVVAYDEIIDCKGKSAYIDGFKIENWKSVGELPFYDVIKNSSNVGVAIIAKRLGKKFYDHLRRLGFGSKTGIEFPGERKGFVNPPEKWSKSSLLVMSFGYEITASILQLARAIGIIANGGYAFQPTLLAQHSTRQGEQLYSSQAITTTKKTLEHIGNKYPIPGFRVMAKTGTARCVKDGKYSKKAHVYTFGGIIEKENYKRVIVTFVQEPSQANLWAAGVAGPIFHNLAQRMVIYETTNTHY
ncbi:MAG: Peptidoglycan transglycosylase and transpeptidase FtsI [candidate division TM6 bacterium GW2011_GWF2_38_10]|nr:MAG: Peptidoglycan transglycosylase and transpeptidase FtsI [candidate division TM6 bacterium GW2011_GWF2_38_10]